MSCRKTIARGSFDSPTVAVIQANGTIQFVNHQTTCDDVVFNGGDIVLRECGDYEIHFNATTIATAAGVEEIQMFRNGTAVAGAHALETAAAVGDASSMAFTALVTVSCCGEVNISFRSIPASSIRVANVTIDKVR